MTWSCNAKANVPRKTLEVMKDNGLRLLLVGYESGNQQILFNIKKGMRVEFARRFTKDCHELGIVIHGTFILGLPGETRETIQETLDFAKEINPHTIQVSLAAPYPGTFLYRQAKENGWLYNEEVDLLTQEGTQIAPLNYPHLSHTEIFESVEDFYKKFYFRPSKIASIVAEMIVSPDMMKRRLREGVEFFQLLTDPAGRRVKRLIVTADDFGAAREVNEAVEAAHRGGILTAASLMVAAPAADDAVARARRMPSLRVGLHVVLVEGHTGAPGLRRASSRGRQRQFSIQHGGPRRRHRGQQRRAPRARRRDHRTVRGLSRNGLALDHCNAHKHFQLHPVIGSMIAAIGARFGLRAARVPFEPPQVLRRVEPGTPCDTSLSPRLSHSSLRRRFRAAGLLAPDRIFGLRWSGHMTAKRLLGLIRNLPGGLTEIYLHPATGPYAGAAPGYQLSRGVRCAHGSRDCRGMPRRLAAARRIRGFSESRIRRTPGARTRRIRPGVGRREPSDISAGGGLGRTESLPEGPDPRRQRRAQGALLPHAAGHLRPL